jgi:hypothetical protein
MKTFCSRGSESQKENPKAKSQVPAILPWVDRLPPLRMIFRENRIGIGRGMWMNKEGIEFFPVDSKNASGSIPEETRRESLTKMHKKIH